MTPRRILTIAALPLLLALAACSGPATIDEIVDGAQQRAEEGAKNNTHSDTEVLPFEDLPDCDLVAASAAELIGDFVPSPDNQDGANEDRLKVDIGCTWLTPETVSGDVSEIGSFGGLSIGVAIEKNFSTRAEMEAAGLVHEYAPADDADAYVVSLNPEFDPADELSAIGVIVNKGNVSVTLTAVGVYIDASNIVGARTNATAIDAALRIHQAMRE